MWDIVWWMAYASLWTAVGVIASISIFLLGTTYALGRVVGQFQRMVIAVDSLIKTVDSLVRHIAALEQRVKHIERRHRAAD